MLLSSPLSVFSDYAGPGGSMNAISKDTLKITLSKDFFIDRSHIFHDTHTSTGLRSSCSVAMELSLA